VLLAGPDVPEPIKQDIFLGDFPEMTDKGTFIINGTERVVVSQLIRSPGVYFEAPTDRATGRSLAMAKLIPDRVHPGEQATLVMAEALLKSWNAPAIVTEVEIDAGRKTAAVQANTRVSDLRSGKGISWNQIDDALPMPLDFRDPQMALVLKSTDFMDALNRQPLRVKGLTAGKYTLRIDGDVVANLSSEQLSSGINLAELPTPMTRQAAGVHALTLQHNSVHATRWRQIQVPLQKNESPEELQALKALDELETRLIRDQRAAAQPQMRRFELTPE
jgi:hypothetical protein